MEMRIKTLLPVVALVGALSFSSAASAQQSGTADDAKSLLAKAAMGSQRATDWDAIENIPQLVS